MWSDILNGFKAIQDGERNSKDAQYLLGPVVLVSHPESFYKFDVIDGQQRLSTLTMLFCVARDIILEDIPNEENSHRPNGYEEITSMTMNTVMGKPHGWKLVLNDTDKEFFELIQEAYSPDSAPKLEQIKKIKPKTESLELLRNGYMTLHKKITESLYTNFGKEHMSVIDGMDDDARRRLRIRNHAALIYFLTHVMENNYLIQIIVADAGDAFEIFETLNERGRSLSKSNLIKNRILSKIKDDWVQKEQSDKWNRIFDEIKGKQPDDDFIMESYCSRIDDPDSLRTLVKNRRELEETPGTPKKAIPEMSKKNLYKVIRNLVTDERACRKFIKELEADALFLSTLNDPSAYEDDDSSDDIHAIKMLKAESIRAPILAAHRKWANDNRGKDYTKLVKLLVKLFFKIRVVRQIHPTDVESITHEITGMINKGSLPNEVFQKIIESDSHDDFNSDFKKDSCPSLAMQQNTCFTNLHFILALQTTM